MEYLDKITKTDLDCLLVFVPKLKTCYRPIGKHMFTVLLPMGLMAIADFVHRKGYKVQILHLGLEKIINPDFSLTQYLAEVNPKVVGLSLHWHYQCHDTIETVKEIKLFNRNIFTVLGGLTASYFHKEIIEEFNLVDGVIRGDGEIPLLKLLDEIFAGRDNLSDIPNLTWRYQDTARINGLSYVAQDEDLNELNFTNFKLLKNYLLYIKMQDARGGRWLKGIVAKMLSVFGTSSYFPLLINKGCLVNCSYCGGSKVSQSISCGRDNVSVRSVEKVVESIKEAQHYNYKEIYITYSPFHDHNNYFKELFGAIKKEKIKMSYLLECSALPTKEIIQMFNELLIKPFKLYLGISPESGNEHIRKLNKGFYYSNNELMETLDFIASLNIPVILYFSTGLPYETIRDSNDTICFQELLKKKFKNIISISTVNPVLEPVSPMYLYPEKHGIVKTRNSFKDFIQASKDVNECGFLTPKLGYFKRDFCELKGPKQLSEEEIFRGKLQKIICKSSCRVHDFMFSKFPQGEGVLIRRTLFLFSRLACNMLSLVSSK